MTKVNLDNSTGVISDEIKKRLFIYKYFVLAIHNKACLEACDEKVLWETIYA